VTDMKGLKLKHNYHDAIIREIRFRENADVFFDVELCSCCNLSPGPVTLGLLGLRNFTDVQSR